MEGFIYPICEWLCWWWWWWGWRVEGARREKIGGEYHLVGSTRSGIWYGKLFIKWNKVGWGRGVTSSVVSKYWVSCQSYERFEICLDICIRNLDVY